jgi:hypothetical protein
MTISLGALIVLLEKADPQKVVSSGLGQFFSFRGEPAELGVAIDSNISVQAMLDNARNAVGKVFDGYKGGRYSMGLHSQVNITYGYSSLDHCDSYFMSFVNDLFYDSELHAYKEIPVVHEDDDEDV